MPEGHAHHHPHGSHGHGHRDFWDEQASSYDRRTAWIEDRWLASRRRWVCHRAHGATLEVGSGTGANIPFYPADVTLTVTDSSPAMLREARTRARVAGRAVTVVESDGHALPFGDATFDTVVATFVLCCVADERAVIAEMRRVLRPGGDLLLADHVVATSRPLRAIQRLVERVTARRHGEHFTRRPRALVEDAGLTVVAESRGRIGVLECVHARRPG